MDLKYLEELKQGVILTGMLSEVHVESYKMYPHIFFDYLKSAEVSWDIDTDNLTQRSNVDYSLTFNDGYEPDLLKERVNALVNSTRFLLWKDLAVNVTINGKKVNIEELNGSAPPKQI